MVVETGYLISIIYILFYSLIGITIIAFTSIIMLAVLISKRENQ